MIVNANQLQQVKKLGKIHNLLFKKVYNYITPGISTLQIDNYFTALCKTYKVNPAQIGYMGYKYATCIGIDSDAVHNVPNAKKIIQPNSIVTFDSVIEKNGLHMDGGFTKSMPKASKTAHKIAQTAKNAFLNALRIAVPHCSAYDIAQVLYNTAKKNGFTVLIDFAAHGIGYKMHECPNIPNMPDRRFKKIKLKKNMLIALDTMIVEKSPQYKTLQDGWSTKLLDGGLFAFYERTFIVTENGGLVLN